MHPARATRGCNLVDLPCPSSPRWGRSAKDLTLPDPYLWGPICPPLIVTTPCADSRNIAAWQAKLRLRLHLQDELGEAAGTVRVIGGTPRLRQLPRAAPMCENILRARAEFRGPVFFHTWTGIEFRGPFRGPVFFHTWTPWTVTFKKKFVTYSLFFLKITVHGVHV